MKARFPCPPNVLMIGLRLWPASGFLLGAGATLKCVDRPLRSPAVSGRVRLLADLWLLQATFNSVQTDIQYRDKDSKCRSEACFLLTEVCVASGQKAEGPSRPARHRGLRRVSRWQRGARRPPSRH